MLTPHPRATYRFQFHAGFTFRDALHQLPYLQALGISHVYASPIATARTGSSHGYDVCDPRRVNPELGGEDGLMTLLLAVRERGLGWLQDVVPNHMAADVANPLWRKVLAFGPGDPSAALFDIDWDNQRSPNKLLLPILARPLADVLDEGGMRPSVGDDGVVIACADQRLPISPRSLGEILSADHRLADLGRRLVAGLTLQAEARDEHFAQIWQLPPAERQSLQAWCEHLDRRQLEALLARQYWQASWWRLGREVSGYRRFFNIDGLVGVAVERPEAFALQHTLAFGLWDAGLISGVRVDHIDGLRDPRAYLRNLRERMPEAWIVVEKILGQDERLPADWPVDGTTGYESIALLAPACSDPAGLTAIRTANASWCGDRPSAEQDRIARRDLHRLGLHGDAMRIVRLLRSHDANDGRWFDVADAHLAEALAAIAARLDRYRTYGDPSGAALILATARRATEDAPHLAEVILRLGSLLAASGARRGGLADRRGSAAIPAC